MSMKLAVGLFLLNQAMAFPLTCPNFTVIHDHNNPADPWYDGCLGLTKMDKITTAAACETFCKGDVKCSVWQFVKPGDDRKGCWAGYPTEGCQSRASTKALQSFENQLEGGQRIQHGFIKVDTSVSLIGKVVKGLKKLDFVSKESDEKEAERCKMVCYTDTTCTAWQMYRKPAHRLCLVEHLPTFPKGAIVEPAVAEKQFYVAGEVIEHTCPPYVPPKKKKGLPWPWIIGGSLLGLLALIPCLMYLCKKTPKVKKTRAMKIEPVKAEEPAPVPVTYLVPQPTMQLIPQQSVIMQQPLVQQQVIQQPVRTAPVAQYTSVPMVEQVIQQPIMTSSAATVPATYSPVSSGMLVR